MPARLSWQGDDPGNVNDVAQHHQRPEASLRSVTYTVDGRHHQLFVDPSAQPDRDHDGDLH